MLSNLVVVGLILTADEPAQPVAEAVPFFERVRKRVKVAPMATSLEQLAGTWSEVRGSPLSGSVLYLFPDGTYLHTRWSDILPETVYDKGSWRAQPGLLTLTPDDDVTWDARTDRQFLIFRGRVTKSQPWLLGLDQALPLSEHLSAEHRGDAETWLVLGSLAREGPWAAGEADRVKKRLGKDTYSWRPCFFTKTGCPDPGPNVDQK